MPVGHTTCLRVRERESCDFFFSSLNCESQSGVVSSGLEIKKKKEEKRRKVAAAESISHAPAVVD